MSLVYKEPSQKRIKLQLGNQKLLAVDGKVYMMVIKRGIHLIKLELSVMQACTFDQLSFLSVCFSEMTIREIEIGPKDR